MKRLVLVALILLSGTAHAVPKPAPLDEMVRNRFTRVVQVDEVVALKLLPTIEDLARDVRAEWVESYEGWKDRTETLDTTTESLDTAPTYAGDIYDQLAMCESGMDPTTNTGNGYYGAFQFLISTFQSLGYSGIPTDYSYAVQKQAAIALIARSGWGQFPGCAAQLGML